VASLSQDPRNLNFTKSASPHNTTIYKNFRNIYNSTLRLSKKLYFESSLKTHEKNPRKTWELLKETTGSNSNQHKIESIIVNGSPSSNPNIITEEFNRFFATAGVNISNSV
jgi:hypothetical protein